MFSCAQVFSWDSRSRRSTYRGWTCREKRKVSRKITGVTASMDRAKTQSVARNTMDVVRNSTVQSMSCRMTQHTAWRTMSMSPVRRVIRSPVRFLPKKAWSCSCMFLYRSRRSL